MLKALKGHLDFFSTPLEDRRGLVKSEKLKVPLDAGSLMTSWYDR